MSNKIDPKVLTELLDYQPETGLFFWRKRDAGGKNWNVRWAGKQAFTSLCGGGYFQGHLLGQKVLAHRVAWAASFGEWPDVIDHINGVRSDNRLENLRNVSWAENNLNLGLRRKNQSGANGVRWSKGAWQAEIRAGGKSEYLGRFVSLDDAIAARKAAEPAFGFHPNHGRAA